MKISNNTVLITGGSSGIGLALAKAFIRLNNKVIIAGRDLTKLERIKREIPEICIYQCELSDQGALDGLVAYIEREHPELNVLINNAAVQYSYSFADIKDAAHKIDYEIRTNLNAPLILTTRLLPVLGRKQSAVVNVSSALAIAPKKSASVYCATKSAIHSFTKTLRYQLQESSINVFEIIPPLVETAMTEGRGASNTLRPEQVADVFLKNFETDRFESYIGKSALLRLVHRLSPGLAERIMKDGV